MTSPATSDRHLLKFEKRPKMQPPAVYGRILVVRRFACLTNWWASCLLNILKLLELATSKFTFECLCISTGNGVTSYFRSAFNRTNVSILVLGHVWSLLLIMVQLTSEKFYNFGKGDSGASFLGETRGHPCWYSLKPYRIWHNRLLPVDIYRSSKSGRKCRIWRLCLHSLMQCQRRLQISRVNYIHTYRHYSYTGYDITNCFRSEGKWKTGKCRFRRLRVECFENSLSKDRQI